MRFIANCFLSLDVSLTYLPATSAGVLEIQLLLLQYDRHLTFIELVF